MSKFDFENLTLDEIETIENLTGGSIDKIADNGTPKGKNLKAIIFVMMRRNDPQFTMEMAGQFTLTAAMEMFTPDPKA